MKIIIIDADKSELGGASRSLFKIEEELKKYCEIFIFNLNLTTDKRIDSHKIKDFYIFFLFKELIKFFYDLFKINSKISDLDTNDDKITFLVKNYRLVPYLKFFLKKRVIFLCSGFAITDYLSKNYDNFEKKIYSKKFFFSPYEMLSLFISDKIISNSHINERIIKSNFKINTKIDVVYTSEILDNKISGNDLSLRDKKFDLVFVSSNIDRSEKNFSIIKKIYLNDDLKEQKKIVITSSKNNIEDNYQFLNYSSKESFFKTLRRSKIILIPSKFDSSPNVFYESILNNCIPIVSNTCGVNHFDSNLVLKTFEISRWIKTIKNVLINYESYQLKLLDAKKNLIQGHDDKISQLRYLILNE